MEVQADLTPILGGTLIRLDSMRLKQLQNHYVYNAINSMGQLSAEAMCLKGPLTTTQRVIDNPEHTLYLMWEKDEEKERHSNILGILKVGKKTLFFYDKDMDTYHGKCMCVLDFYVHWTKQRSGIGQQLFEFMLQNERIKACELALDNPSVTLLAFMAKHYNLHDPVWQNTNFVVYSEFFDEAKEKGDKDGPKPPQGWTRPSTPRHLGGGMTGSRYLVACGKDADSKERHATTCSQMGDLSNEGTLANRAQSAKQRKQHILSSNPLW